MNKKGELVTLTFAIGLLAIILFSAIITEEKENRARIESNIPYYVGDSSNRTAYNIRSNNSLCNLDEIKIEKKNLVILGDHQSVINVKYKISDKCS